jgi:TM2 domain-containing membrane protein YozV
VRCFAISASSFTQLNPVSPCVAAVWSAVIPGAGCFMLKRMNRALYLMVLWVIVAYLSGVFPAIISTLEGDIESAKAALNVQWFLNLPSLWFFGIYEAYACAIGNNKLYRWELSKFLKKNYQSRQFIMPI